MGRFAGFAILAVWLSACSPSGTKPASDTAAPRPQLTQAASQNPVAKYLELAGFRLDEKGPGNLQLQFAVINHSDADIGNITLQVNVRTKTGTAKDQPLFSFPASISDLG